MGLYKTRVGMPPGTIEGPALMAGAQADLVVLSVPQQRLGWGLEPREAARLGVELQMLSMLSDEELKKIREEIA